MSLGLLLPFWFRPEGLSESFHDTSADDFFAEIDLSPKMLQFGNT